MSDEEKKEILSKAIISKQELCLIWRLEYSLKLSKYFFTDEVLNRMNLTREAYNNIKVFDVEQTRFIKEEFKNELGL